MPTILITGGTGLVGTALTEILVSKGYKIIILSRSKKPESGSVSYAIWDINKGIIDKEALAKADHIIHLAGAGVADKRWTAKRKQEIVNSRVNSGKLILKALQETDNHVQTIISASAIGWYGPDIKGSNKIFSEIDPPDTSFLGETCRLWEQSIEPVTQLGKRLVILRTGIVLSNKGGAFKEFKKPLKAGIAGIMGSGKQIISWVHIDDLCRIYTEALENSQWHGIYNAVAPEYISNKTLTLKLARVRKKPFIPIHIPSFVLKLILGEMSIEVLKSTTVSAEKIRNNGFKFLYQNIDAALNELITTAPEK